MAVCWCRSAQIVLRQTGGNLRQPTDVSIAYLKELIRPRNSAARVLWLCLGFCLALLSPGCTEMPPPVPPDPIPTFQPKTAAPDRRTGPMVIGAGRQRQLVAPGPTPPVSTAAAVERSAAPQRIPLPPVAEALSL